MKAGRIVHGLVVVGTLFLASAYADTIDNPGDITLLPNVDTFVESDSGVTGSRIWLNQQAGTAYLFGAIDGNGDMSFGQADIFFETNTDSNGFEATLQPIADGVGAYCPNSGQASVKIKARIRITKVNGNPVTNCTIPINGGNYFDLTTETSGSLTGVRFSSGLQGDLVATVSLGLPAGGGVCGVVSL